MPVIGYLSNKVDPRYLLTFGFVLLDLQPLYFGSITLQVSPTTLLIPILITGFGLSFLSLYRLQRQLRHAAQRANRQRQRLI